MMRGSDEFFGLILALASVGIGLITGVLIDVEPEGSAPGPLVGRDAEAVAAGPPPEYHVVARQTAAGLARAARDRRVARVVRRFRPEAALASWRGVLVVDASSDGRAAGAILAAYAGSPEHEEGPPFHFLVDREGRIRATRRWRRQRPWRVAELEAPQAWIIVVRLASESGASLDDLVAALRRPEVSRGGRAERVGWDGPARIVEKALPETESR